MSTLTENVPRGPSMYPNLKSDVSRLGLMPDSGPVHEDRTFPTPGMLTGS